MEHKQKITDGPNDSGRGITQLSFPVLESVPTRNDITLVTVATRRLPPDVGLGHDALQTITEFKEGISLETENKRGVKTDTPAMGQRQHGLRITFSRRLALKMDLNPNWKYSRSKGSRAIMSSCGGTDEQQLPTWSVCAMRTSDKPP